MDIFSKIASTIGLPGKPESQKLESINDQTAEELKLAGWIKGKVDEARMMGSRIAHEAIWMTNIAYMLGFNSVFFDSGTKSFRTNSSGQKTPRRSRLHVNKILPTIQNRTARLCKSAPKYDTRPKSSSSADKEASRLSLDVLNMVWDKQQLNFKRLNLIMWAQECGHAFVKVCWDESLGEPLMENGQVIGYEGDIRIEPKSALQMFCDPLAKTMDEVTWLCETNVRKLEYFREKYPERGHLVKEEGSWLISTQYEQRINSLTQSGSASGTAQQMKDAAIEVIYYEKRSRQYPKGRQIAMANGVLLEDKDLPVGIIPFAKFDDILIAGKFYSESIITHLRPIQDQINRLINKRAEWTNRLLNGKFIAAKGHGMGAETLNDQSGEVVEYNPVNGGTPPTAMNIPVIPQYAYTEEESLNTALYDIAGINEISRGQLPSAGIPAIGMQFLQEQDETRIGLMTEQHELSWAYVGQLILRYASEYYKTPRLLKEVGSNMEYAVQSFVGADLKENYDVYVIRGSTLPSSKVLKRQEILNAFNQGLLGDPADPKVRQKVLGMLEYGDIAEAWKDQSLVESQVRKDIKLIEGEKLPSVHELDDHAQHVKLKNEFRLSDKFGDLTDQAKLIFETNLEEHLQWQMKRMNPELGLNKELAQNMQQSTAQVDPNMGAPDMSQIEETSNEPQGGM